MMKQLKYTLAKCAFLLCTLAVCAGSFGMDVHATGYYGRRLKGNARTVYNNLEKAGIKKLQKCTKNGTYLKLSRNVSQNDCFQGYYSYIFDHPELYWAQGFVTYGYGSRRSYIAPYYLYYYGITSDFSQVDKEMNKAIRYVKKKKGRYNKVKAAHDYLDKLVDYAYGVSSGSRYTYAGMISKNGRRMVCAGYAKAFQRICLANNIPCLLVTGQASDSGANYGSHAWNYVQMTDKKWYLVDCTWDDRGRDTDHIYFLAGSRDKNWWGRTMASSHIADKVVHRWNNMVFYQKLPSLSKTGYR